MSQNDAIDQNKPDDHSVRVGDITDSEAVAIGAGARAEIHHHYHQAALPPPPFMVEDLPIDFVPRLNEYKALIAQLLDEKCKKPVSITAALRGAGGYGKTVLAQAVCHDERIRQAFADGILWVTLGERPGDIIGLIVDWIKALTGNEHRFTGIDAAKAALAEALSNRKCLLVIDDVWNRVHLTPFMHGGSRCARLITTRNSDTLPENAHQVNVDAMQTDEAVALLCAGLDQGPEGLEGLACRLGEWPLLLKLANGALRERVSKGQTLPNALAWVNKALDKRGLTAFDAQDAQARSQAVDRALGVSLELLNADERARYGELAIFPEDTDVPLVALQKLWGAIPQGVPSVAGELDDFEIEALCERLERLSLLLRFDLGARTIRLHDVVRAYLAHEQGDRLPALQGQFLDAYHVKRWADLPVDESYVWDHLAYHMLAAGRGSELVATVKDLRYLATKTHARNAYSAESDLAIAEGYALDDIQLRLLKRNFVNVIHLLNRCQSLNDIAGTLHGRLQHLPDLSELCRQFEPEIPRPFITAWHALPDLPHPALIRTLAGHLGEVTSCSISPDGAIIVSTSSDGTLKVWDTHTGIEHLTLEGHTFGVTDCTFGPDGTFIVSASSDRTLRIWPLVLGSAGKAMVDTAPFILQGHVGRVQGCAISPDGTFIASASEDCTLKIWDIATSRAQGTRTGLLRQTLEHAGIVRDCAISPDGTWVVSALQDKTLRVWQLMLGPDGDEYSGHEPAVLEGHKDRVNRCAISPDGTRIVSASSDHTLKIWDARTGKECMTLQGHTASINGCSISPDGTFIVSASSDCTLKIWSMQTGAELATLEGHVSWVQDCAVSLDGTFIVSASADGTLKVWSVKVAVEYLAQRESVSFVNSCAVSPDGSFVVSASYDGILGIWDTQTGNERSLKGHAASIGGCAISPDGAFIVSASCDGTLKVWDTATILAAEAQTKPGVLALKGHLGVVWDCTVSPDKSFIVSASYDGTLKVWSLAPGPAGGTQIGIERMTLKGHKGRVTDCVTNPDGTRIISASSDGTLKIWDVQTGTELATLQGHTDAIWCCAISPSGTFVVSASNDGTLKVWQLALDYASDIQMNIKPITLKGHTGAIWGCAVSPDGHFAVSASADCTLKVWDIQTRACLATLPVAGSLYACAFCPDGEHIVAAGERGMYFLRWERESIQGSKK